MLVKLQERKNKRRLTTNQFDINWDMRFNEIKLFKERFGHTNVPQYWKENKSLGGWVIHQRAYREYLSPDRKEKLLSLGFIWNLPDYRWEVKYKELKKYKKKHGTCDVPKGKSKDIQLAEWVGKQRRDYKKGYKRLSPEKIQKLEAIDFNWGANITPWAERFNELKEFSKRFGYTAVPCRWRENPQLAAWVSIQRRKYNVGQLLEDRIKLLESIDFKWRLKAGRQR